MRRKLEEDKTMNRTDVTGDELLQALVGGTELMRREVGIGAPVGAILGGLLAIESAFETAASMVIMSDAAVDDEGSIELDQYAIIMSRLRYQLEGHKE
jgi:hypothetical protein